MFTAEKAREVSSRSDTTSKADIMRHEEIANRFAGYREAASKLASDALPGLFLDIEKAAEKGKWSVTICITPDRDDFGNVERWGYRIAMRTLEEQYGYKVERTVGLNERPELVASWRNNWHISW